MNIRYRSLLLFFGFIFSIIFVRLFYWQVVRAQELAELGSLQYGKYIKQTPKRGEIRTVDNFPIATNKINYLVFLNPKAVPDSEKIKLPPLLAPLLQIDEASISSKVVMNRYWVPLKHNVEYSVKEQIEKLNIEGIGFEEQTVRFYPEASLAAKLIGFVGKDDEGNDKGYFGLEGYYERQLAGKSGLAMQIKDAQGKPILAKMNDNSAKVDGRNIILHVDRSVQFILEEELRKGLEKYGAQAAMGVIMDPKTGGILGMSSFPSFDQRSFQDYTSDLYLNPIISSAYEPGSTFKPLIMAAGIDSEVIKPETQCPICDKPVEIGGYTIKTWNNEYQAGITMANVIRDSDNTGMVYVSQKLGLKRMYNYLEKYGIGSVTGIDLQGEMAPDLRPIDSWYPIDVATSSFGQGISVTAMELISAFASLANDGKRMEPHVVENVETPDGEIIPIAPKVISQPVSSRTTKIMREILVNAVKKGEAKWAAPKGYRIAGKTGTAQIPIEGHYDSAKTIASFIGYAPADAPKFVMLIVYDRPTSSIYGSETAAPTFFNIATKLLAYYRIPPTE
jgi:cell division protein FtsI/penicillin-binding protein 2